MTLPTAIGAYNDCFDYFTRALETPKGIRICFANEGDARFFLMRMNQARALQRMEAARMYPADSPLYNRSEYDVLQVRRPIRDAKDEWWIYVEPHNGRVLAVEDIEHYAIEPPHEG